MIQTAVRERGRGALRAEGRPGWGPAALGTVRSQRRLVGDNGAGLQPELGDEAVGLGSRVGEPKAESGAPRQDPGHQSEWGSSLIPGVGGGAAEHPRPGPRAADGLSRPGRRQKPPTPGPQPGTAAGLRPAPAGTASPKAPCFGKVPSGCHTQPQNPFPMPPTSQPPSPKPQAPEPATLFRWWIWEPP